MICIVETRLDEREDIIEVKAHGPYKDLEEATRAFFGDGILASYYTEMNQIMHINNGFVVVIEMEHPHSHIPF